MPDLMLIEGGADARDDNAESAEHHFGILIIELLRALARGEDHSGKILRHLKRFIEYASAATVPAGKIIHSAIQSAHRETLAYDMERADHENELRKLLRVSLPVIAESLADDPLARGRLSSREEAFRAAFEQMVLGRETRSRENGWSYTKHLTSHLEPPRPAIAPRKTLPRKRKKPT